MLGEKGAVMTTLTGVTRRRLRSPEAIIEATQDHLDAAKTQK